MIRSALLAAVSAVVLGSVAMAADLPSEKGPPVYAPPPPPVFSWTGFYIGGQVGYGWGADPSTSTGIRDRVTTDPITDTSGIVGGGHIGYNYQISQFVLGLEADANGSTERGSITAPSGDVGFGSEEFDASIRARVGIAFDRILVYATGGGAYGAFRVGVTDPGVPVTEVHYPDHFGWTVGGGIEYAIDNNWSVRAEYRYTDYGPFDVSYTTVPNVASIHYHIADNRVQVGFSYLFNPPPPPAPPVVAKY
jgi:outer membrane immunogenic protein